MQALPFEIRALILGKLSIPQQETARRVCRAFNETVKHINAVRGRVQQQICLLTGRQRFNFHDFGMPPQNFFHEKHEWKRYVNIMCGLELLNNAGVDVPFEPKAIAQFVLDGVSRDLAANRDAYKKLKRIIAKTLLQWYDASTAVNESIELDSLCDGAKMGIFESVVRDRATYACPEPHEENVENWLPRVFARLPYSNQVCFRAVRRASPWYNLTVAQYEFWLNFGA